MYEHTAEKEMPNTASSQVLWKCSSLLVDAPARIYIPNRNKVFDFYLSLFDALYS